MKPNIFISYSSPAGSTRHVAEIIKATLADLSANIHILDVTRKGYNRDVYANMRFKISSNQLYL